MGELFRLSEKQQKIVEKIISDNRGRWMDLPHDPTTGEQAKILDMNGLEIGQITIQQAMTLT
jgi:hypothetical protein